jgi:DNA invertase Pin-like site-specific DNA recombinase
MTRDRAALYARYSTDLQNERSVEDQFQVCRAYAAREQLNVIETFEDRARSGAAIFGRDGLIALMERARAKAFDFVIVEALDRLSRDMEDLAGIHKRLSFYGIELRAVHDGRADTILVGLRGLVGQLFREDGAKKVRRGMAGVIRDGRVAGGCTYGYRTIAGRPGERELDPDAAAIVLRILTEYAAGKVPREIAGALNREGVPAPRGRRWNASTINGNAKRGSGLIFNELYAGRLIWNKVRMVKDPETGHRLSRVNAPEERTAVEVPHLRIVDDELWQAVQSVKKARSHAMPHLVRRPPHLLSGLLRCGVCGGGMSVHDRDKTGKTRIRCSAARESGTCSNRRILYLINVERAVVDGMRQQLRNPRLIGIYIRTYNEERRRLARNRDRCRPRLEEDLATTEREYQRVMTGYIKGFIPEPEAEVQMRGLRAEIDRLTIELASGEKEEKAVKLHPRLIDQYLTQVDRLAETCPSSLVPERAG